MCEIRHLEGRLASPRRNGRSVESSGYDRAAATLQATHGDVTVIELVVRHERQSMGELRFRQKRHDLPVVGAQSYRRAGGVVAAVFVDADQCFRAAADGMVERAFNGNIGRRAVGMTAIRLYSADKGRGRAHLDIEALSFVLADCAFLCHAGPNLISKEDQ